LQAATPPTHVDVDALIKEMFARKGSLAKIAAIKLYRNYNPGVELADAKQYVERLEAGLPPDTVTKPPPGCSPIVVVGVLIFGAAFLFIIFGVLNMMHDSSSSAPSASAASSSQASSDIPLSTVSWSEIDEIYNLKTKYTDLQKDEFWKRYKGKKIRWSGTVSSISESFGNIDLQVKMNPDTFTSDLVITLRESQKSRALGLKKDDSVTFTGVLDRWGSILPITLKEGELIY
jgi:hypothetical protein